MPYLTEPQAVRPDVFVHVGGDLHVELNLQHHQENDVDVAVGRYGVVASGRGQRSGFVVGPWASSRQTKCGCAAEIGARLTHEQGNNSKHPTKRGAMQDDLMGGSGTEGTNVSPHYGHSSTARRTA